MRPVMAVSIIKVTAAAVTADFMLVKRDFVCDPSQYLMTLYLIIAHRLAVISVV